MVDGRLEEYSGWRVRVVGGKGEGELEGKVGIGRIVRAVNGCGPGEEVAVSRGEGRDTRG